MQEKIINLQTQATEELAAIENSTQLFGARTEHLSDQIGKRESFVFGDFFYDEQSKNDIGDIPEKSLRYEVENSLFESNFGHSKNSTIPGCHKSCYKHR